MHWYAGVQTQRVKLAELLKLRKKTTSTVQVLTHVKEKLQYVQQEVAVQKEKLALQVRGALVLTACKPCTTEIYRKTLVLPAIHEIQPLRTPFSLDEPTWYISIQCAHPSRMLRRCAATVCFHTTRVYARMTHDTEAHPYCNLSHAWFTRHYWSTCCGTIYRRTRFPTTVIF